jgi:membrane associated rhomboid family serine protease
MYMLYFLGMYLERVLPKLTYLALYLVCGIGGNIMVLMLARTQTDWYTSVLGASGAIFGVLGALIVVSWNQKEVLKNFVMTAAINLGLGFMISGVSWQAHLGGLVTGLMCGYLYQTLKFKPRGNTLVLWSYGVILLAFVALAAFKISTVLS